MIDPLLKAGTLGGFEFLQGFGRVFRAEVGVLFEVILVPLGLLIKLRLQLLILQEVRDGARARRCQLPAAKAGGHEGREGELSNHSDLDGWSAESFCSSSGRSRSIAAPVAAVAFIVDAAAGLVNKSVPQFQVFAVITPAKVGLGLVAAMAALPILTTSITAGVNLTFHTLEGMFK